MRLESVRWFTFFAYPEAVFLSPRGPSTMQQSWYHNRSVFRSRWVGLVELLSARLARALPQPLAGLIDRALPGDRQGLAAAVLDSLQDQIAVIDDGGTIVAVNRAWRRFAENNGLCTQGSWEGVNYLYVLTGAAAGGDELADEARRGMMGVIRGERDAFYCEYPCHSPDVQRWFMMRFTPLEGCEKRFVVSHHDITLRKQAEEKAETMALHDALTGLANRRYFNLFLDQELRRSLRDGTPVSLVAVDVDHFKQYNDQYGHIAGDECLADIGGVLARFARRPGDLAVRMGGDEFALILGNTDSVQSHKIARELLNAINELNRDSGRARTISVSVGVASRIQDESCDEDFLLHEADRAMYSAKQAGRNRLYHVDELTDKSA